MDAITLVNAFLGSISSAIAIYVFVIPRIRSRSRQEGLTQGREEGIEAGRISGEHDAANLILTELQEAGIPLHTPDAVTAPTVAETIKASATAWASVIDGGRWFETETPYYIHDLDCIFVVKDNYYNSLNVIIHRKGKNDISLNLKLNTPINIKELGNYSLMYKKGATFPDRHQIIFKSPSSKWGEFTNESKGRD